MLISFLVLFMGTLITSGTCLLNQAESGSLAILSNDNFSSSTSLLEALVETECKKHSAGLQDQINELKTKVDRLEVSKSGDQNFRNNDHSFAKGIKKRAAPEALQAICTTSSSLCTYYHPDHPDASNEKGKYSPTVTNEMLGNKVTSIPTGCKDLKQLGHSLNGLYLVKKSLPKNQGTKIEAVFCKFQSPTASNGVTQDVIGEIDVKTKSVHFYVQRKSYFNSADSVIPFQLARLNEGNAFDLTSGIFTAPVPGIYHFQFSGLKSADITDLSIFLQLNGTNIGEAFTLSSGSYDSLSLSASLRLVAKDKVNLFLRTGILEDSNNGLTHFSGWLVEEYLK